MVPGTQANNAITVLEILRRGHLAPLTQSLVLKVHAMLRASSSTVLRVLATTEWPVRGSLGDLLQAAVVDTPPQIWDQAFDLSGDLAWLCDLIPVEVPRTYSISNCSDELLPSTVDLTISRAGYKLCDTFAGDEDVTRYGVSSGFLNPPVGSADDVLSQEQDILIGVSRPVAFQLPIDAAAPCAYFAGGSGIAPFRSFWQARVQNPVGRNILYLGVQNRDKFSYEDELRHYVNAGMMEVHLAFSRDKRGLAYDSSARDLVEKETEPRYIDSLIVEQGATVCDLVMSKKQGGLGGYLYICGSVAVFDSVMNGIRKAIYNHRTATMDSTDIIINAAFAERRIMLDVFMTPKPLPCNRPTIPLSELAKHTGHRPGTRTWIGVHGSAYDVTDFAPMHPGGTLILKSNAGVDCSESFDNLAHTNNPEVASLLTKYFIGHLTPKPDFHGSDDLSSLYDLWSQYLRTTVETLVAQQFEMEDLVHSQKLWFQEGLINMLGVRIFYQYQSRLLQGGFSALFGPKFQELVLKLSFMTANSASAAGMVSKLPDILGAVSRATTSSHAMTTMKEVSSIGELILQSEAARLQQSGIMDYASKAVALDIELLEDIRAEACQGMDAFDSIMELDAASSAQRVSSMCSFLMQLLERMARRLDIFYAKLARHSIYQPSLEQNPARTRWQQVRQRIRDGSFFVLARTAVLEVSTQPLAHDDAVDFDGVLSRVQNTIASTATQQLHQPRVTASGTAQLNERRRARADVPPDAPPAFERFENESAARRMSTFISQNMRAMRRLSQLPALPQGLSLEDIMKAGAQESRAPSRQGLPTPPSSRASSRSPTREMAYRHGRAPSLADHMKATMGLNRRRSTRSNGSGSQDHIPLMGAGDGMSGSVSVGKLNSRKMSDGSTRPPQAMDLKTRMAVGRAASLNTRAVPGGVTPSTGALRSLRLAEMVDRKSFH
jgi:cytochrome b involved in lipid metabolism